MSTLESKIAFNHHYYIAVIDAPQIRSLEDLVKLFYKKGKYKSKDIYTTRYNTIIQLQLDIRNRYGGDAMLQKILVDNNPTNDAPLYRYDFYIGNIFLRNKTHLFICYPYSSIINYIESEILKSNLIVRSFIKPKIDDILDFIENISNKKNQSIVGKDLTVDITKYTANITNDDHAKRVSLTGVNPLESKTYSVLEENGIDVEAVSLKLRLTHTDFVDLEFSFSRSGNCKFWPRKTEDGDTNLPMIIETYKFFQRVDALYSSNVLPIENEKNDS